MRTGCVGVLRTLQQQLCSAGGSQLCELRCRRTSPPSHAVRALPAAGRLGGGGCLHAHPNQAPTRLHTFTRTRTRTQGGQDVSHEPVRAEKVFKGEASHSVRILASRAGWGASSEFGWTKAVAGAAAPAAAAFVKGQPLGAEANSQCRSRRCFRSRHASLEHWPTDSEPAVSNSTPPLPPPPRSQQRVE